MDIQIFRLTPERLDDYLYFFENVAHTDNKEWDRCYCLNYCSDANTSVDFQSPDVRRKYAVKYVNSGKIQGYLAYHDNNIVGWCNANRKSDCMQCGGWKYISENISSNKIDEKIKSIFCFTVAPNMRGNGIAEKLLRQVCEDAIQDGYNCIESYPNKVESDMYYNYAGPMPLYQKLGFTIVGETEQRYIMQKNL